MLFKLLLSFQKSDEFRAVSAPVSKDKSYVKPWQQKEKPKASLHPKKPTEADSMDFTEAVKPKTPQGKLYKMNTCNSMRTYMNYYKLAKRNKK